MGDEEVPRKVTNTVGDVNDGIVVFGPNSGTIQKNSGQGDQTARLNLSRLADELAQLRSAMRAEATTDDHDVSLGNIAKAEKAARSNDQASVLEHLKAAGRWALDVATKIGVTLATETLKKSLGLD